MKYILIISCFLFLHFSVVLAQKNTKKLLSCIEFYEKIEELDNTKIFDLRSEEDFDFSRITDAILVDTKEKFSSYLKDIDKDSPIFIYCEEGVRSEQCSKWLTHLGYTKVYQLKGGFKNWKKEHYPVDTTKIDL